eukprot:7320902-Prymnesium_polylepis.1
MDRRSDCARTPPMRACDRWPFACACCCQSSVLAVEERKSAAQSHPDRGSGRESCSGCLVPGARCAATGGPPSPSPQHGEAPLPRHLRSMKLAKGRGPGRPPTLVTAVATAATAPAPAAAATAAGAVDAAIAAAAEAAASAAAAVVARAGFRGHIPCWRGRRPRRLRPSGMVGGWCSPRLGDVMEEASAPLALHRVTERSTR